jgi:hypothetical protein
VGLEPTTNARLMHNELQCSIMTSTCAQLSSLGTLRFQIVYQSACDIQNFRVADIR